MSAPICISGVRRQVQITCNHLSHFGCGVAYSLRPLDCYVTNNVIVDLRGVEQESRIAYFRVRKHERSIERNDDRKSFMAVRG